MEISKKKLLSLLEQNLKEMAMDYESPDRPDSGVEDKLRTGDTPHKKIPYPSTEREDMNFQELLASASYKDALQKVRRYTNTNFQVRGMQGMMPLVQMMTRAYSEVIRTEANHHRELEVLAIKLVIKQMGLGEIFQDANVSSSDDGTTVTSETLKIVAKITSNIDMSEMDKTLPQNEPEQVNLEKEILDNVDKLDLERAKRRFINTIIQGAASKGFYMYHFVEDEIREITGSETLLNNYGVLMSINKLNYWQFPEQYLNQAMGIGGGEGSAAGSAKIDRNSEPPTIYADAVTFPALVHELIKTTMEYLSTPDEDDEFTDQAYEDEDKLAHEVWDLRFGTEVWDRIRNAFPEEIIVDENQYYLQNYLLDSIFTLPAKQFLVLMKEVMSGSDIGKRLMSDMLESIKRSFQQAEYEDVMDGFNNVLNDITDDTEDEDINSFLNNIGIGGNINFDDDDDDDEGGVPVMR